MRKVVNVRVDGRQRNKSVRSTVEKVYRELLKVPGELRARLPNLENIVIILIGRRPVRHTMTVSTTRPPQVEATEIRKRIEKRAAAWRERHGAVKITPKNYTDDDRSSVLYIKDPAARTTLAIDPDRVAKLLGASTTVAGRNV